MEMGLGLAYCLGFGVSDLAQGLATSSKPILWDQRALSLETERPGHGRKSWPGLMGQQLPPEANAETQPVGDVVVWTVRQFDLRVLLGETPVW